MKNAKRMLLALVVIAIAVCCAFAVACGDKKEPTAHECLDICTVCGNCKSDCTYPECEEKCPGHAVVEHECKHVCPETGCGKCKDQTCTDPKCSEKCPGHEVVEHECKHVCPEAGCGKCLDDECGEPECAVKCPGHESEEDEYTVIFQLENGTFNGKVDGQTTVANATTVGGKLASLPEVTPDGVRVRFLGWYTTLDDTETTGVKVDTEYTFVGEYDNNEVTIYARYRQEYLITLNAGEGTLPANAKTEYVTIDGIIDLDGARYLPEASINNEHWFFMNWYNGDEEVDEFTTVFTADTELVAKYGRRSGVWSGENADVYKIQLIQNTGASGSGLIAEYWFGGGNDKIQVEKGEKLTLYLEGKLISFYVTDTIGVESEKGSSSKSSYVTVTVSGELSLYLKHYTHASDPDNYTCQWLGASEVGEGDESAIAGCAPVTVTWAGGKSSVTFYLKDVKGNAVGESDLSKFALYTYGPELFGGWTSSPTAATGLLSSTMTSANTNQGLPTGWIFRWGSFSGDSNQTADILTAGNKMVNGGIYLVELVSKPSASKVTAITLSN